MAVVLTAVVVTNAGQNHAEISQVLQDFGYRTLLMLVSDDDIPGGIAGMPENVDLIIFDMEALDDPALRNDVRQSLSERGIPLIFLLGDDAILRLLSTSESSIPNCHLLSRPMHELSLRIKLSEIRGGDGSSDSSADRHYRDLFRTHNDAILIHNADGRIIEANPQAARLLGGNEGNPVNTYLRDYEPHDFTGIFREMMDGTWNRGVVRLEVLLQNARNSVFSAEAFTGRISGERDEFYTVIRDISQRKMIEEQFKHRLNMESAMSLIAAHFISDEDPREKILQGLEQIGQLSEADTVRMEFYDDEYQLFAEPSLSWFHRRKISGERTFDVDGEMRADILDDLLTNEYVYTESWQGRSIPRLFVIPLRYDDRLIAALWIHRPDRPLVYEDRILFVMIAEMFRSYFIQQVSDSQRRELISSLEEKIGHLNCLFSINHLLREEYGDLMEPLRQTAQILCDNLTRNTYLCVAISLKDQQFCAGECPWEEDGAKEALESLRCFHSRSGHFDFVMEVYLREPGDPPSADRELIRAVFNELGSYLEQAHLKIQRSLMEIQLHHTQRIEAMGQLASGIAHEMNTPNQYIQDNLNFLKDNLARMTPLAERILKALEGSERDIAPLPYEETQKILKEMRGLELPFLIEEMPKAIAQSLEGIGKQRNLIDAMRSYSHPGENQRRLRRNVNRIIEEALVLSKHEWVRLAVVETDLSDDLPEIPCYPQDLSQVFINILVNAAHAIADRYLNDGRSLPESPPGRIRIHSRLVDDMAEISISDNGTGISDADAKRIFEPFYTTKEVGKGTGQGLAIAYEIIENRHKGQILLRSDPGVGSEFRLLLPIDEALSEMPAVPEG
jgi:PAS domain S-box-containing protein